MSAFANAELNCSDSVHFIANQTVALYVKERMFRSTVKLQM